MSTNNVSKSHGPKACCPVGDETAPPTPQIRQAIASAGIAPENARFNPNRPPSPRPAGRDPIYFEFANWEPGTVFEMVNRSNDPTATFDTKDAIHRFEPTGRDVLGRQASVFIPTDTVEKMNWDPGDTIMIRAVDAEGNSSAPASARIRGEGYGEGGRVLIGQHWQPASRIGLLDGEGVRKNVVLRHIADDKPPVTKHFEKSLRLEKGEDGKVTLKSPVALEPGVQVTVRNGRSGESRSGNVGDDGQASVFVGDVKNGDSLFVTVRDASGVDAAPFEVRYSDACKDGRANTLGILGARLPGAIKVPKS